MKQNTCTEKIQHNKIWKQCEKHKIQLSTTREGHLPQEDWNQFQYICVMKWTTK